MAVPASETAIVAPLAIIVFEVARGSRRTSQQFAKQLREYGRIVGIVQHQAADEQAEIIATFSWVHRLEI